ncbi:hypothetical protein Ciccas_013785, partial [Cichlidogyrus casuarinus]
KCSRVSPKAAEITARLYQTPSKLAQGSLNRHANAERLKSRVEQMREAKCHTATQMRSQNEADLRQSREQRKQPIRPSSSSTCKHHHNASMLHCEHCQRKRSLSHSPSHRLSPTNNQIHQLASKLHLSPRQQYNKVQQLEEQRHHRAETPASCPLQSLLHSARGAVTLKDCSLLLPSIRALDTQLLASDTVQTLDKLVQRMTATLDSCHDANELFKLTSREKSCLYKAVTMATSEMEPLQRVGPKDLLQAMDYLAHGVTHDNRRQLLIAVKAAHRVSGLEDCAMEDIVTTLADPDRTMTGEQSRRMQQLLQTVLHKTHPEMEPVLSPVQEISSSSSDSSSAPPITFEVVDQFIDEKTTTFDVSSIK